MKKQRTIRYRSGVGHTPSKVTAPEGSLAARAQLADIVARLTAEDPARARAFLLLLRKAAKMRSRSAVCSVLAAFGGLGGMIAEAARPTPLRVRPASLADSWNAVGRSIGAGLIEYGERHDRHVG